MRTLTRTLTERVDEYARRTVLTSWSYQSYLDTRTENSMSLYEMRREALEMYAQTLIDLGIDVKEHRKFPERHILVKTHAIQS